VRAEEHGAGLPATVAEAKPVRTRQEAVSVFTETARVTLRVNRRRAAFGRSA